MTEVFCQYLHTPIGKLRIAVSNRGVCRLSFPAEVPDAWLLWFEQHFDQLPKRQPCPMLDLVLFQLTEYFEGKRRAFDVPVDLRGTPFQLQVWRELRRIPYGLTVSYGEIARRIRNPRATQAVGAALGRNPVPIIVPCHRVLGHQGSLVGFGGGLPTKEKLLELEGARMAFSGSRS